MLSCLRVKTLKLVKLLPYSEVRLELLRNTFKSKERELNQAELLFKKLTKSSIYLKRLGCQLIENKHTKYIIQIFYIYYLIYIINLYYYKESTIITQERILSSKKNKIHIGQTKCSTCKVIIYKYEL
jgi:hypothetical protein